MLNMLKNKSIRSTLICWLLCTASMLSGVFPVAAKIATTAPLIALHGEAALASKLQPLEDHLVLTTFKQEPAKPLVIFAKTKHDIMMQLQQFTSEYHHSYKLIPQALGYLILLEYLQALSLKQDNLTTTTHASLSSNNYDASSP